MRLTKAQSCAFFLIVIVFSASQLLVGGTYMGLALLVIAGIGVAVARTLVAYVVNVLTLPLAIAFDFFLRVDSTLYFYKGNGITMEELCSITTCTLGLLQLSDSMIPKTKSGKYIHVDLALPRVPRVGFLPLACLVLFSCYFVTTNAQTFLSATFDNAQLQKFPWLEYVGLLIVFLLQAAKHRRSTLYLGYAVSGLYVGAALLASYRMVGIIAASSVLLVALAGRKIPKLVPLLVLLAAYLGLSSIAYFRQGAFDVTFANLLGYQGGRLDNTFTGVIETALIYTALSGDQSWSVNLAYLLGAILPIPNMFIPDSMLYVVDAQARYHLPGGGLLAGFFAYFNLLLLPIIALYVALAFRFAHSNALAAGAFAILFITAARWWLYGPYVIFKFFGVYVTIYVIVLFARWLVAGSSRVPAVVRA